MPRVEPLRGTAGVLVSEPKSNEPTAPLSRVKTASGFAGAAVAPTPRSLAHLGAGTVVSRYRVESVLGEGGMGVVYIARQEKPDREVALKVVRPGYATPSMLRRFEYESEVLGRLLHPGIAQIYEAGTADAGFGPQPFFAMELVKGVSLTRHASEKKLSTRERLELLAKVCDAVQHAHQKGVIHRDLKPGNILVGVDGQPKILDFGVARATGSDIQQTTMQTDVGAIVGTIPYMSPEQVGGDPNELDTRSDVYALGVIAYELLVGRLPYDLERKMIHEAARIIREDEPTRLSSINRTLRGDVETIVGHALEKDKARRYSTASALAADIRRYLSDEPIAARPSSTWYQVQKFSRRNRALVGGIVVSFLILLMGLGGTAWQARIARAQRDRADDRALAASAAEAEQRRLAEAEAAQRKVADEQRNAADEARRRAESINEFVTKSLQASDPNQGGAQAMTVTQAMSQALADLDRGDLNEQPATVAALLRTISQILNGNGRSAEAEAPAERALDLEHRLHSGDHAEVATSLTQVAQVRHSLGRSTEAELLFAEALEMRQRLFKGDHLDVAASLNNLALVRLSLGHAAEAEPLLEEALEMTRRLLKGDHREVADALNSLAGVRRELGRVAEAERLQLEELEMLRRLYGGDHPLVARDLGNLAGIRDMLGHSAEAEVLYVQALEMRQRLFKGDHPDVAVSLNNLAFIRGSLGRLAEAEPLLVQALEMQQRLYEGDHPEVAVSLNNVAYVRQALGRAADAEPLYVQSLEMRQRLFKGDHVDVAQGLHNLGYVLSSLGRASEAEPLFVQALEMLRRLFKGDHPYIAKSMNSLAYTRASLERAAEAEPLHVEALEMYQRLYGDEHPDVAETMMTLARCLATLDRLPESLARAQAAADMAARILPEGHPTRKKCDDTLAYIKKKIEAADPTTPAPPTPPPATSPPPDGG